MHSELDRLEDVLAECGLWLAGDSAYNLKGHTMIPDSAAGFMSDEDNLIFGCQTLEFMQNVLLENWCGGGVFLAFSSDEIVMYGSINSFGNAAPQLFGKPM